MMGITKITALSLIATLFALCGSLNAQQSAKVYRIGILRAGSVSSDKDRVNAFREGLREVGYVEGKNVVIDYGYADGNRDTWPKLAAEMVRLKPARFQSS
jgi:putative tryptophan/tyrosine transport system substrate-binding protein